MADRYVLTLVHGTLPFRRLTRADPAWTKDRSIFCRWIREDFEGCSVDIKQLEWTGRNSAMERKLASERLATQVNEQAEEDPTARQIVVGHSHGGTIALMALHDPLYAKNVAAIVCLSTPCLHVRHRYDSYLGLRHLLWSSVPAVAIFIAWTYLQVRSAPIAALSDLPQLIPAVVVAWIVAEKTSAYFGGAEQEAAADNRRRIDEVVATVRTPPTADGGPGRPWHLQTVKKKVPSVRAATEVRLLGALSWPDLTSADPLFVRVAGDEASGLLTVGRIAGWFGERASDSLLRGSPLVAMAGAIATLATALTVGLPAFPAFFDATKSISGAVLGGMSVTAASAIGAGILVGVAAVLVGTAVLALFALAQLGLLLFGTDLLRLFTRFEFSVEDTPPGRYKVEQLSLAPNTALFHSVAYNDRRVPTIVRQWVAERERAGLHER